MVTRQAIHGRADDVEADEGISVVVPVYNSQDSLDELARRIEAALTALGRPFELILVNDGSRDRSWERVRALAARHPWVRGIDLMRNFGQHNALLCGIRAASRGVVITLDDDLQNPPEEIPKLLALLDGGADVAYGTPGEEQHGLWRNLASRATKVAMQAALGVDIAPKVSAFRAFRAPLREAFGDYQGPHVSIDVLLTWATTRFASAPVAHAPRQVGQSQYSVRKLIAHALNMVTGYSTLPLRVASLVGFATTLFGVLVLAYVIGRYLIEGGSVAGFPFLASIIAVFSGAQLFAIGVIGEYLSRMYFRMMGRPSYAVRERTPTA